MKETSRKQLEDMGDFAHDRIRIPEGSAEGLKVGKRMEQEVFYGWKNLGDEGDLCI